VSRLSVLTRPIHLRLPVLLLSIQTNRLRFFLGLIELEQTTAACMTDTLMKCLHDLGLDDDVLRTSLICFASDGASVMVGTRSGVASMLLQRFPQLVGWHCSNHRLELAFGTLRMKWQDLITLNRFSISCTVFSMHVRRISENSRIAAAFWTPSV